MELLRLRWLHVHVQRLGQGRVLATRLLVRNGGLRARGLNP